jgi:hypothetical protein
MLFFAAHGVHFLAPAKQMLRQHGSLTIRADQDVSTQLLTQLGKLSPERSGPGSACRTPSAIHQQVATAVD